MVFTDAQVAGVGLTEDQALAAGHDVKTSVLTLDNVPRALAARDTRGLIKLVAGAKTDRLPGGVIAAPEGCDSIQTLALALRFGMTTKALGETIFPYLTTVKGLKLAAQTFDRDVAKLSCCGRRTMSFRRGTSLPRTHRQSRHQIVNGHIADPAIYAFHAQIYFTFCHSVSRGVCRERHRACGKRECDGAKHVDVRLSGLPKGWSRLSRRGGRLQAGLHSAHDCVDERLGHIRTCGAFAPSRTAHWHNPSAFASRATGSVPSPNPHLIRRHGRRPRRHRDRPLAYLRARIAPPYARHSRPSRESDGTHQTRPTHETEISIRAVAPGLSDRERRRRSTVPAPCMGRHPQSLEQADRPRSNGSGSPLSPKTPRLDVPLPHRRAHGLGLDGRDPRDMRNAAMNGKSYLDPRGAAQPGRRGALALLGSAAFAGLLPAWSAQAGGGAASALAFDGDALIAAGAQVWRYKLADASADRLSTPRAPIRALACHPERSGRLFAAYDCDGIARSEDGGQSWRAADSGLPSAQVTAFAIAAGLPDTIYAFVADDGLWRSEDAGES